MDENTNRPIPKPRRTLKQDIKINYENVAIKTLNQSSNKHNENSIITQVNINNNEENVITSTSNLIKEENIVPDENKNLINTNTNKDIENVLNSTPIPSPRKPSNYVYPQIHTNIYENSKEITSIRKAPEIPPKTYLEKNKNTNDPNSITARLSIISNNSVNKLKLDETNFNLDKSSETSGTSVKTNYQVQSLPNADNVRISKSKLSNDQLNKSPEPHSINEHLFEDGLQKSGSNLTLNSTVSSSSNDSKFKNPNPKDILKSIGTTSKLLSESISERVAFKAKGAKHKIDKNLKSSGDLIQSFGHSVGQRINNLTLKKDKKKTSCDLNTERPQTVPPNNEVFNISFNSPINKSNAVSNLALQTDDNDTYEIPKSAKIKTDSNSTSSTLPSYEDVINESLAQNVSTGSASNSPSCSKSRNLFNVDNDTNIEQMVGKYSSKRESYSLPMPKYPPPSLPGAVNNNENIYGKIQQIRPPLRQKHKKTNDNLELAKAQNVSGSDRATIDSVDIRELQECSMRDISMELKEKSLTQEKRLPDPDRSDSWQYFESNNDDDEDCSSPEPLYMNQQQECGYGKLSEMASRNIDILSPVFNIPSTSSSNHHQNVNKSSDNETMPKDILYEFDPLIHLKSSTICKSDKSNELLLLEHLLHQEIYGTANLDACDDVSSNASEEDNGLINSLPKPPKRIDSLVEETEEDGASSNSEIQIVHRNSHLPPTSSSSNFLNENAFKSYLTTVDPHVSSPDPFEKKNTRWFVKDVQNIPQETISSNNVENIREPRENPFNKPLKSGFDKPIGESPPTYSEAMAGTTSKITFEKSKITDLPKQPSPKLSQKKSIFSNVMNRMDVLKRKSSIRSSGTSDVRCAVAMIPRPQLTKLLVRHEGPLIRFGSGVVEDILKEMQSRKAIIREKQFLTFLDQDMKQPKESIPLEIISTIQCVSNSRITDNATHLYCFELTTTIKKNSSHLMSNANVVVTSGNSGNSKMTRVTHLYGVGKESERDIWMQKLIESLTDVFPSSYTCQYYRSGWCYLKKSISSEWSGSWIILSKRKRRILFYSESGENVERVDLRKARCIVSKDSDDSIKNLHVETGPTLMIDAPPFTIYMIMCTPRETKLWRQSIREVAHNNGPSLIDQQLTKFHVPVIVDKCINFIYIHGSMSEGIYRKSGSENSIVKMISMFRMNAFSVEITRNEYNEHDIANVLKRFMRDLPQRLLGKYSESFMSVSLLESNVEKISAYKELLSRLLVIEYETLKKIIGHLTFIHSQRSKNKMTVNNLAMIWGPTLLQSQAEEMSYSQKEADVIADLIMFYKNIFPLSSDEIKKEQEMLMCLQKYYSAAENLSDSVKKSGDIKIWITLNPNPNNSTEEKNQMNVTLTPTKTSYDICKEVASKMNIAAHQLTLYEVILNDGLERPLHHEDKVFDLVLKWSYWPEDDRKNNYLVVKPIDIVKDIQRAIKNMTTVTCSKELKFADNKTKSFKSFQIDLREGKVTILKKEKSGSNTIYRELFLHSSIAYLGCEKKRDFPWSWAITIIEDSKIKILRTRDSPYIGHVIAGSEWVDRTIWYSNIWYRLYGENIMPPAEIIIK